MSPLDSARIQLVQAHIDAERRGDFDAARATFHRPRYEIVATGELHDGDAAVAAFYEETARAFPDLDFQETALRPCADAVVVETTLVATHRGSWRGLPPTGRRVAYRMANVFVFEWELLVAERMYFDLLTPLRQIGVARDPTSVGGRIAAVLNHPWTVGSAFARSLVGSE